MIHYVVNMHKFIVQTNTSAGGWLPYLVSVLARETGDNLDTVASVVLLGDINLIERTFKNIEMVRKGAFALYQQHLDAIMYLTSFNITQLSANTVEIRTFSPITTVPVLSSTMTRATISGSTSSFSIRETNSELLFL